MAIMGAAVKILELGAINTTASKTASIEFGPSAVWAHVALARVAVNDDDGSAKASIIAIVEDDLFKQQSTPVVFVGFHNRDCTNVVFRLEVRDCVATALCTVEFF
jgi:hypothetical protein